ncbi:hypothetical protein HBH56_132030 [Parastagonospora nodorum]|uniref:Uncharacterized protein n=2 Tax=Phaeosphaeria nodorum (strain SN15 / ATCC MYA-4574 / FGSC 10173) TaxID=321614 RepID=A0A7U2FCR6_PHANO|nr:hypothetical protein SNOG_11572 [Parastagonospora nodorum SN15]KAH3911225.1 hypothetical protein HBH56_132030 [Parastagonospora nodorum]EAT81280.1 hypothetical protein SNOG_11572 [Parastagonospora nodorum SN15]KAH3927039.1 hypothetical protein HBH54_161190 [Parastagonospora nodorum]KAH4066947.1 hypothetical protein HBH50_145140 [Parastagonospora nodorum]KAH4085989.1 hypothetical protein HBH48_144730 [Parastagonospora nodorum]
MVQKLNFDKKKLRALYASYGENDLFNSGRFKALTRNLTTGALLSQTHHCERCEAKMKTACYENLHYGFCSEWATRNGKRERCGERFAFRSQGCGKHPRQKGYNAAFYKAAEGEDVKLCDFDDLNDLELDEESICKIDMKAEMEIADKLLEKHLEEHGYVSASFHSKHFARKAAKHKTCNVSSPSLSLSAPEESTGIAKGKSKGMSKTFKPKKDQKVGVAFAESFDCSKDGGVAPTTNSTFRVRAFQSKRAMKKG